MKLHALKHTSIREVKMTSSCVMCFLTGKNFLYVEPCKRVKEILEEELCFWKEECHIRHPAAGNPSYEQMESVCQGK